MQRYGAVYFCGAQTGSSASKELQERALQIAGDFSPWVEKAGRNLVVMDLSGLSRQWPDEKVLARAIAEKFHAANLRAQIAISSNRTTARLAASGTAGITIILSGQERAFLAPLPLELLDPPIEVREVFDRWGLKTIGDLADLPERALAQRVDEIGMELYRQACGKDAIPLLPYTPIETFEVFYAFDWPLGNSESLAFTLNHLLDRLCRQFHSRSLVAESVSLSMHLADRSENMRHIRFGFPLNDVATILSLLRLDLEARPPEAAIESLLLRLYPTPSRTVQFSLFEPSMIAPEKLARTLARLCALVGESNVGSPVLLNTYRPDAFEMKPFELRIADSRLRIADCGLRNGRAGKYGSGGAGERESGRVGERESGRAGERGSGRAGKQNSAVAHHTSSLTTAPFSHFPTLSHFPAPPLLNSPTPQSAIRNPQSAIRNRESAIRNPQSAIENPQSAMALRIFRPSLPARVRVNRARPVAVEASMAKGDVIECGGPWRTSGEWWEKDQLWARDEWDVLLRNGQLYRIYRDLRAEQWFVFGAYD